MAELWETLTIGLVLSLFFIGLSYFFWQRYDRPTPLMIEREEEKQRLKAERKTWRQVEVKMEAERMESESKARREQQKAKAHANSVAPDEEYVAEAWSALGVEAPKTVAVSSFQTDEHDTNSQQEASVQTGLGDAEVNDDDVLSVDDPVKPRQDAGVAPTEAPDWEIIEKIAEIAEKDDHEVPEVPEAPDLPSVEELLVDSLESDEEETPSAPAKDDPWSGAQWPKE